MAFELQPTLRSELLELRPLRHEDFQALYAVASDPLIWEQHPANDRYKEDVFAEFFRQGMQSGGALAVIDPRTGAMVGSSRYNGYNPQKSEIEIGWTFLARSHWGGLYNRQMKQVMVGHALKFVQRVFFRVGTQNIRSQRALEKIGAIRVGQSRDDQGIDIFVYQILAPPRITH